MATFLNLASRQTSRLLASSQRQLTHRFQPAVLISTSKKNKDAISAEQAIQSPVKPKEEKRLDQQEQNWMSFGYDYIHREHDEFQHHMYMFLGVGVIVWGAFIIGYFPDFRFKDWAHRQAYLQIEKREKEGLPLLDPNYADPQNINLPSDEELGDTEIII